MKPVVIVGAGLAGLICARELKRHRVPCLVLEAEDRVGGRLKTDTVGADRIDRGYQVYFTGYPTAGDQIDVEHLDLHTFEQGAVVVWDGDQHLISPARPLQFALSNLLSASDKFRLARWTSDLQWLDQDDIDEIPDRTIERYLLDEGFSTDFLDRFARPFLSGVFLDRSLSTSCRQLLFVWKALTQGDAVIPKLGMEAIPRQIAVTFGPDMLHPNTGVEAVLEEDGVVSGVQLRTGDVIEAERVVLATDAVQAASLSGLTIPTSFRSSIALYFRVSQPPVDGGWLVLNGNMRGVANHLAPLANGVVAVTILGERPETDEQLSEIVKAELRLWFPNRDIEAWQLIHGYRTAQAQMVQEPGFQSRLPGNYTSTPGLYFAGEFTVNSSIDGAIRSGLACAEIIIDELSGAR